MNETPQDMRSLVEGYLTSKGWEYRESGNEQFLLKVCPLCKADRYHHFYIGQYTGLWDCKSCGQKGNFNKLRHALGDEYIDTKPFEAATAPQRREKTYSTPKFDLPIQYAARLWSMAEEQQKYLMEERGLTKKVLEDFKIGVTPEGNISIPIYENGKLVNIRYRYAPQNVVGNQRYTQEKGCRTPLYNSDVLKAGPTQVYITEGELDALHLIQRGFHNTMSTTLGASSFPQAWLEGFENVKEVFFVYDTDDEGLAGARKAAEKIGVEKCKFVKLPTIAGQKKTDLTDYFTKMGGTKDSFLELVDKAEALSNPQQPQANPDEEVKHISEFSPELRKVLVEGQTFGISTGYSELDEKMGGLRKGRMVIVSGLTNTGKSSFSTNICLNLAHANVPSFYFSLEMPPIDIVKKVLQLKAKLENSVLKQITDPSTTMTQVDATLTAFKDLPIYLYAGQGVVEYPILDRTVRYAVAKYDVKVVFVDHLHYFAQNYNNLANDTSRIVRSVKQLARDLDITIVLLAHLNRGGRAKQRTGLYTPSLADLKDTGTIEQDADQVIFVCRDSENEKQEEREKAVIKVAKNRDGQAGQTVSMVFSEAITSFVEATGVDYAVEAQQKAKSEEAKQELQQEDIPF